MPQINLRRCGHGRRPPSAPHVAIRRAPGIAMAAVLVGLQLLAGGARAIVPSESMPGEPPTALPVAASFKPVDEFERLQFVGRAQPELATVGLLRYVDTLAVDSPRHLEALMELGSGYVGQNKGDEVEQVALRIEALSDRLPLARPCAMLLRGQWMQTHGEVSKAERQIIEAQVLLPAALPDWLRLRLLMNSAFVKNRGGHYDEAMARYNQALKLADETGPMWRRIDLRALVASVLFDAGQTDKAAEINHEQMRLATESADEFGISSAYTMRAIEFSRGRDSGTVLADWRAALEHARLGGSKHQILIGMGNIADYYLQHGDFQTAYDLADKALPLAVAANDLPAQSVAVANKGLALIGMHHKDEGLPLVRQSNSIDERSGTAVDISEAQHELGDYLERAGYLDDALAAYHQYRQLSEELNQQDRQRALIELQESFANENRQHELDMLGREGRLKDEEIRHHELQVKQWTAGGVVSVLLLAVVAVLARRLRVRNQLLSVSNEQLRLQAEIDPLTGLSNRHHLQAVMADKHAGGLEGTLYLLDVDHFKQINDRCGHAGGDTVLVEIARRLRQVLRDDDLIVRWGGEEFLVLVRPLPQGEADALAQRLLCALAEAPVMHDGDPVPVSASIGFAPFPLRRAPAQGELPLNWERAISLVDAAMYLAKAHGRNGACSVRSVDAEGLAQVEELIEHLEKAAGDGRAELHFQQGPGPRQGTAAPARAPEQPRTPAHGAEVA
ncbi:MAG: GGDEF domain-containing protein [Burkholderiales bacterium]|nr:GGDEF domain-containing protein [Burkholderiales bacterium]